jgi:hypothetical protein
MVGANWFVHYFVCRDGPFEILVLQLVLQICIPWREDQDPIVTVGFPVGGGGGIEV